MVTKTNNSATPKPHDDYYLGWILTIAAAANVELPEATQAVYLKRLRNLSGNEMRIASERTIEEWREPSKMPPLPFVLDRIGASKAMVDAAYERLKQRVLAQPEAKLLASVTDK